MVDKNTFPAFTSIAPGAFTDVYIDWTPNYTLTPEQIAGVFNFHTCLRVTMSTPVADTFPGNQDGDGEQENIFQFEDSGQLNLNLSIHSRCSMLYG
jgi:hypothetical protein